MKENVDITLLETEYNDKISGDITSTRYVRFEPLGSW